MKEKSLFAAKNRFAADTVSYIIVVTDFQKKYTAVNPLPDPSNERDITTFITIWKDSKNADMKATLDVCQTAEDILR